MPIARALGADAANDLDVFIARRPVSARSVQRRTT
jgi:hypothetical protein